ncbi:MAG: sensor histidine kinase, partial [Billgrantia desiderata]
MTPRTWRLALLTSCGLLVAAGLWAVWQWQYTPAAREAERHAQTRLTLYTTTLQGALESFAYLPGLLVRQPQVQAVLLDEAGIFDAQVNAHLAEVAERSGAEAIFLMDAEGVTVAASNHASEDSF